MGISCIIIEKLLRSDSDLKSGVPLSNSASAAPSPSIICFLVFLSSKFFFSCQIPSVIVTIPFSKHRAGSRSSYRSWKSSFARPFEEEKQVWRLYSRNACGSIPFSSTCSYCIRNSSASQLVSRFIQGETTPALLTHTLLTHLEAPDFLRSGFICVAA